MHEQLERKTQFYRLNLESKNKYTITLNKLQKLKSNLIRKLEINKRKRNKLEFKRPRKSNPKQNLK